MEQKKSPPFLKKNSSVSRGFPKKFLLKSLTPVLIILLFIASFFLGSFYTKNQDLEKQLKIAQTAAIPQPGGTIAPTQPPAVVSVTTGNLPVLGNKNAKVTVVEFADFRCPYCEKFYQTTEKQIIKEYVAGGKVKFAFRHYAFLGPESETAANAAECANEQGKFWEFHNYLYDNQPNESDTSLFTVEKLTDIALTLGIDSEQFRSCLSTNKYSKNVSDDLATGQSIGVGGTPTTFINGRRIEGALPYTSFKALIDQALK